MRKHINDFKLVEKLQLITILLSIEDRVVVFYVEGFSNFSIPIFWKTSFKNEKILIGNFNVLCLCIFVDRRFLVHCVFMISGFVPNVCFPDVPVFQL